MRFIAGDPYRNGGSVNMFGVQQATGGSFSNSMYDFTADFSSTFAHAFSCAISVENFNPAVFVPGTPLQGFYIVDPDAQGNEEAKQQSCNSFTANGPSQPFWGEDHGQCLFVKTVDAVPDSFTPAFFDPPAPAGTVDGTAVNQTQTDMLMARETFGAGFTISDTVILGQVVVCISPSKTVKGGTPGAWANHNGYIGTKCNTTWFNTGATAGVSNLNLQGTFISVPLA